MRRSFQYVGEALAVAGGVAVHLVDVERQPAQRDHVAADEAVQPHGGRPRLAAHLTRRARAGRRWPWRRARRGSPPCCGSSSRATTAAARRPRRSAPSSWPSRRARRTAGWPRRGSRRTGRRSASRAAGSAVVRSARRSTWVRSVGVVFRACETRRRALARRIDVRLHTFEGHSKRPTKETATVSTASLEGARDHARSQDGAAAPTARTVPVDGGDRPPRRRRAAATSSGTRRSAPATTPRPTVPAGTVVRIADTDGDACVHLVRPPSRRARRSGSTSPTPSRCSGRRTSVRGAVLLSDMGRAMMTIVADTSARHDALCGATSAAGRRVAVRRQRRSTAARRRSASC